MSLPQVGLEAVIAGLPGFEAGASAITKAYDDIEKKGANVAKASNILSSSVSFAVREILDCVCFSTTWP